MNYSLTGIAYLFLSFAVGYLAYRFFQYWQREKDIVSKIWVYFVIIFELFIIVKTIGGLFFANNPDFLEKTVYAAAFIQAFGFATMAYLVSYLKIPKVSPWIIFVLVLILGLIVAVLTSLTSFEPSLEAGRAINWGFPSGPLVSYISSLRIILAIIVLIPLISIFVQQFRISKDFYTKRKSLGMVLFLTIGLLLGLADFSFINTFGLGPLWRDLGFIVLSVVIFITLLSTLPRPLSRT